MGATTVGGTNVHRTVIVANPPDGLHMRPATAFAKLARGFRCAVTVRNGDRVADGRSPHELLMLIALPGTSLLLELDGEDADIALDPLIAILTAGEYDPAS
jgi:phosphotransferase system HPr (HPr) family protein